MAAGSKKPILYCVMRNPAFKTSEKTSDICPFRSFSIPLNLTGILTNSLCCNKLSLPIPLGSSQIDGVANVYDVFASPIKKRGALQGLQKCAGIKHHKGRSPTGVLWKPSPLLRAQHIRSCYAMRQACVEAVCYGRHTVLLF